MGEWVTIDGEVVRGHGVASGVSAENPYPGGTIPLQTPHFAARGLDLSPYHSATLNISIKPYIFEMVAPRYTLRQVNWIDMIPPEDFSFATCQLTFNDKTYDCLTYYPHPETKVQHFQDPAMIEVLAPFINGIFYGAQVELSVMSVEISILEVSKK
jgi:hypothetical protein